LLRRVLSGILRNYQRNSHPKHEYSLLVDELQASPQQGSPLGNNCFKIRISIASKGKGKSGGARIITHIVIKENLVFMLTIYDKSDKENISEKELAELLDQLAE
jgi:hypothetical protein